MPKTKLMLTPGSARTVGLAADLFGEGRIDPGSWTTAVWVYIDGLSQQDIAAGKELLAKEGITAEEEP